MPPPTKIAGLFEFCISLATLLIVLLSTFFTFGIDNLFNFICLLFSYGAP